MATSARRAAGDSIDVVHRVYSAHDPANVDNVQLDHFLIQDGGQIIMSSESSQFSHESILSQIVCAPILVHLL